MRRQVLPHLDGLDPETRRLAESVAHRSGLTVEELASALAERAQGGGRTAEPPRPRTAERGLDDMIAQLSGAVQPPHGDETGGQTAARRSPSEQDYDPAKTAIALESMASWIAHAEERLNETARASADHRDRVASVLSQALSALKGRLETVEHRVAAERPARVEFPVQEAMKALSPLSETLSGLRTDMSRLAERLDHPAGPLSAVDNVRAEIARLRSAMGGLATREEVATLDRTLRSLAKELEQGRPTKDLLTLANAVATLYGQVQSLSQDLADDLHRRVSVEIARIEGRIGRMAEAGADRSIIESLAGQIAEMRRDLASRAEPQQIERLSAEIGSLGSQIAELRANQVQRADFAALKSSLEDVCAALSRTVSVQEASPIPTQLENVTRRLDALASRPQPEPASLDPIAAQLSLLTEKMGAVMDSRREETETLAGMIERLSAEVQTMAGEKLSHEPVLQRFDRLEEELRQMGRQAGSPQVEQMLRAIDEKLERQAVPASALDDLERRIMGLADRFAQTPAEPFRQILDEVATHLKKLQDESTTIAERAAKAALNDVRPGVEASSSDLDALKQAFVELKALQTRTDSKTQQSLRAVQEALEALVSRFPEASVARRPVQTQEAVQPSSDLPSPDRLEAAVRRLHAAALSQLEEISTAAETPAAVRAEDRILAPAETLRTATAVVSPHEADLGNVRANFIAAARRAAQSTLPESAPAIAAPVPEIAPAAEEEEAASDPIPDQPSHSPLSLMERIRRAFDSHRRPLLFGMAFLILAAGTAQIILIQKPQQPAAAAEEAQAPAPSILAQNDGTNLLDASALNPSGLLQSTGPATDRFTTAAFVVDPGSIGDLPAPLPASLRSAALAGDATAVYEIALRLAEGRDIDQDPALAARLFESAAQAGFAPAQERFAMLLDKGIGTARDTKLAATWYERAARAGNIRAMHNLATLLASGVNGKPDYEAAFRWYREAAEAGVRDSQFNLGVLLAHGLGARQDLAKAFKWFAVAATQDDPEAAKKRDELAVRLSSAELATAKKAAERWKPRAVDPSANEAVPPAAGERTAAIAKTEAGRS